MSISGRIQARGQDEGRSVLAPRQRSRLDTRLLWRSDDIELLLTNWSPALHPMCSADQSRTAVIELMLSGSFRKRSAMGSSLGDPNTVVFFNPGEQFEIAHGSRQPNVGLTIRIRAATALRWIPRGARQKLSFPRTEAPIAPAVQMMACHLLHRLRTRPHESMQVEEAVSCLLLYAIPALRRDLPRDSTSANQQPVAIAREYLNHAFRGDVRLDHVASAAGCSPWHLSRVFSQRMGLRMHAYLTRLRLRSALHMLVDGERDLTRLALAVGFSSHSHFSAAFRHEFGLPPSRFRQGLHAAVQRQSSRS